MSDVNEGKRYVFEFSGDFVECHIAPVPKEKAELWLGRDGEALFLHAFGLDEDDADPNDGAHLGRASELEGATHLEGCELRHGTLEITNSEGEAVADYSLEDHDFQEEFVDDVQQIDPESYLLDGGPTLITRVSYTGSATYKPDASVESFDEAGWYVVATDMGGEPFISTVNFENEDVSPGGSGRFGLQEVWLNVPGEDGQVRQLHFAADPEDD